MSNETLIAAGAQAAVTIFAIGAAWQSLKTRLGRIEIDVTELRKETVPRLHERIDSQEGWRREHTGEHNERDRVARERSLTDPMGTRRTRT